MRHNLSMALLSDQRLRAASTFRPRCLARISLGALALSSRARAIFLSAFYSLLFQIHGLVGERGILPAAAYLETVRSAGVGLSASGTRRRVLWPTRATRRSRRRRRGARVRAAPGANVWPKVERCAVHAALPVVHRRPAGLLVVSVRRDAARGGIHLVLLRAARSSSGTRRRRSAVGQACSCCGGSGSGSTSSPASSSSRAETCIGEISRRWTTTTRTARCPRGSAGTCSSFPHWFHARTVVVTLVVELALVWAVFLPRRFRLACFAVVTALQIGIIATANYAFLNYLVLVLGVLLLDDEVLARVRLETTASLATARPVA